MEKLFKYGTISFVGLTVFGLILSFFDYFDPVMLIFSIPFILGLLASISKSVLRKLYLTITIVLVILIQSFTNFFVQSYLLSSLAMALYIVFIWFQFKPFLFKKINLLLLGISILNILFVLLRFEGFGYFDLFDPYVFSILIFPSIFLFIVTFNLAFIESSKNPTGKLILKPFSLELKILLSFVTFGIYTYFWIFDILQYSEFIFETKSNTILKFICIIFLPFYFPFWVYKIGSLFIKKFNKLNYKDHSVLYLLLATFGLGILALVLIDDQIQDHLNSQPKSLS
jgi:hypothetical protein